MRENVVSVRGLRASFGNRRVFDGFDLDVAAGETVALLGASGCGKSTLLRAIAGLMPAGGGSISATGEIGVVFQEPRLMPWLTVERNVAFAARDADERARVKGVLETVGLSDSTNLLPKELSGGMAQRAALARTLVRRPAVLLMDEPLSALDALLRMELQTALARAVREQGCAAILVTHDVDEALYLADRIVVLAGAPARATYRLTVAPDRRRSRTATFPDERRRLLEALGVEVGDPAEYPAAFSSRGVRTPLGEPRPSRAIHMTK